MQERISFRAAALVIKNHKLLVAKNINHPCFYVIGGGIEFNESAEEAIIREVYEETGLHIEVDRLSIIQERFFSIGGKRYHEVVFFFLLKDASDINIPEGGCTDQGKNETLHWIPVNELWKTDIVPDFLKTKSFNTFAGIEHIVIKE